LVEVCRRFSETSCLHSHLPCTAKHPRRHESSVNSVKRTGEKLRIFLPSVISSALLRCPK